jgi:hypothetical protein
MPRSHNRFARREPNGLLSHNDALRLLHIQRLERARNETPPRDWPTHPTERRQRHPKKKPDQHAFVYFCQPVDGGPIKIGLAVDPRNRLSGLQIGSPVRLRMLAIAEGGAEYEAELHKRFAEWRLHGEWFDEAAPGLADVIVDAQAELRRRSGTPPS